MIASYTLICDNILFSKKFMDTELSELNIIDENDHERYSYTNSKDALFVDFETAELMTNSMIKKCCIQFDSFVLMKCRRIWSKILFILFIYIKNEYYHF